MKIVIEKGDFEGFIDNTDSTIGNVVVSGNNEKIVAYINEIVNSDTFLIFKRVVDNTPDSLILREEGKPSRINKACDEYLEIKLVPILNAQGFKTTIL